MKITRMNKIEVGNSKTLAYFDIETDDGIFIKGFRIISGTKGLFISSPDEKGKDGKYHETVTLPREMKNELEKMALDEYNKK